MIIGRVDEEYNAIIPVDVQERSRLHRLEMPIDTGFDGFLMLPRRVAIRLGMALERKVTMTLANERGSEFELYQGNVFWLDRLREIQVLASENQFLVGRYLLAESHIEIDLTPGGIVRIAKLPAS